LENIIINNINNWELNYFKGFNYYLNLYLDSKHFKEPKFLLSSNFRGEANLNSRKVIYFLIKLKIKKIIKKINFIIFSWLI
jgi:hypothetical protein